MNRIFLWGILVTSMVGCWSKNYDEPGRVEIDEKPTSAFMNANFQRTWAATRAVMAKFPIVKRESNERSGKAYLVTDWIRGKSDILFSGFDVNRIPYVIRYKLYIYVQSDGARTRVEIKNSEQYLDDVVSAGVDVRGAVQTWIKTDSSTLKEYALLEQIDKLVRDPKFKSQ